MTGEPRVRRRVEEPGPDTSGRTGCIAVGAVLGIVAGVLFTFFGLPPILHHFFGETHVAVGETYDGDAKVIRVTKVELADPARAVVTVAVRTNKTWQPRPSDFKLELANGDRVKASAPEAAEAGSSLDFELGVERTLTLSFDVAGKPAAAPRYLHISDPPVRFELPPADVR